MADGLIGNLVVKLDFDGAEFNSNVDQAKRTLKTFQDTVKAGNAIAKRNNFGLNDSTKALHNMQQEYKQLEHTIKLYNDRLESSDNLSKNTIQRYQNNIQKMRNQQALLADDYRNMARQAWEVNTPLYKMSDNFEKVGKVGQKFGNGISELGNGMAKFGATTTLAGGYFAKAGIDFERGMINVQKTTNMSDKEIQRFSGSLRNMAKEMPVSIDQIQQLAMEAAQFGIHNEDIEGFTRSMVKMGSATNLSASEAGEALARFINVTGTAPENIEHLGSAIVHLGNNFATSEREILDMTTGLVGTMSSMGASEPQIVGLATAMSALGITAERGGTAMSTFFVRMSTAASEGGAKLESFSRVAGVTAEQFQNMVKNDPTEAMRRVVNGLADIDKNGGDLNATLKELGITDARMRDVITRLAQGHDTLNSALSESNKAYQEGTALNSEYERSLGSTASQWEIAKNKAKDFAIEIGQSLLPAINDILSNSDGLMDTVQTLVNVFNGLSDSTKEFLIKIGVGSAVLSPFVSGLGDIISAGSHGVEIIGTLGKGIVKMTGKAKQSKGAFDIVSDSVDTLGTTSLLASGSVAKIGTAVSTTTGLSLAAIGGLIAGVGALGAAFAWKLTEPTRNHAKAIKDTNGEYIEWFNQTTQNEGALSELKTQAELAGQAGKDGADKAKEAQAKYNSELDKSIEAAQALNSDIQETNKSMFSSGNWFTERGIEVFGMYKSGLDSVSEAMERFGKSKEEIGQVEDEWNNFSTTINNASGHIAKQFLSHKAVTSEWASEQIDAYNRVKDEAIKNINEQTQAQEDAIRKQVQNGTLEESIGNERIQRLRHVAEQSKQVLEETTKEITDILANAAKENRALTDDEFKQLIDANRRYTQAVGESFVTEAQLKEELGKKFQNVNQEVIASELEAAGVIDESVSKQIRSAKSADEALEIASKALADYAGIEVEEKDLNVRTGRSKEEIETLVTSLSTYNLLSADQKELLVNASSTEEVEQILRDIGVWNETPVDEKVAILRDQIDSESLYSALDGMGVWNDTDLVEKIAKLDSNAPDFYQQVLQIVADWQGLTFDEKTGKFVAEADTEDARQKAEEFNLLVSNIDPEIISQFTATADTATATQDVYSWQQEAIQAEGEKTSHLNAETNAGEASGLIENLLTWWEGLFTVDAAELYTHTNADETAGQLANAELARQNLNGKRADVFTHTDALGSVKNPLDQATRSATTLAGQSPYVNSNTNAMANVKSPLDQSSQSARTLAGQRPHVEASTNAPTVRNQINDARNAAQNKRFTITGAIQWVGDHLSAFFSHFKTGSLGLVSNQLAVLGDGGRREPFLTPSGVFGLSPNTDTLMPLPKGTKIWPSISKFKTEAYTRPQLKPLIDQLPHFATGTRESFLDDLPDISTIRVPENNYQTTTTSTNTYNMNVQLHVNGDSLSRQQADNIIEPLVESYKRYTRKNPNVRLGGDY